MNICWSVEIGPRDWRKQTSYIDNQRDVATAVKAFVRLSSFDPHTTFFAHTQTPPVLSLSLAPSCARQSSGGFPTRTRQSPHAPGEILPSLGSSGRLAALMVACARTRWNGISEWRMVS